MCWDRLGGPHPSQFPSQLSSCGSCPILTSMGSLTPVSSSWLHPPPHHRLMSHPRHRPHNPFLYLTPPVPGTPPPQAFLWTSVLWAGGLMPSSVPGSWPVFLPQMLIQLLQTKIFRRSLFPLPGSALGNGCLGGGEQESRPRGMFLSGLLSIYRPV